MADDSEKPESGAGEPNPPKNKAEDNPWYLLATLYGVPERLDFELREKNRVAWNRYFSANLDVRTGTKLVETERHTAEELKPLSPEELQEVVTAFAERCEASTKKLALPAGDAPIGFSNVEFEQEAFFEGYLFTRASFFQDAAFSAGASFGGATFSTEAGFRCATFSGGASFDGANFSTEASFGSATFSDEAFFYGVAFSYRAIFDGAVFSSAYFGGAAFSDWPNFHGAAFSGGADFDLAAFSAEANFDGVAFSGWASFGNATFGKGSSFVNAELKGVTSFEGATFKTKPPEFFGAELHQDTVWRSITWPPKPKDKDEAGRFIDAYACLKLEMDRLKKHEDELDFFALELQSRRVLLGPWRGLPLALYGLLSDYGRSYLRPLAGLLVVAAIGAGAFWYFDARTPWEALGLSAANTLNVFGFRRDFNLSIDTPLDWLKVFAALQTILGAILLFLLGLGIRNKFRMK